LGDPSGFKLSLFKGKGVPGGEKQGGARTSIWQRQPQPARKLAIKRYEKKKGRANAGWGANTHTISPHKPKKKAEAERNRQTANGVEARKKGKCPLKRGTRRTKS